MKKIILAIAILTALTGTYFVYQNNNQVQPQIQIGAKYYQNLKNECETSDFKECCLDSVKTMEVIGGYKFGDFMIDGCADGYEMMQLRCPGAYTLCNPANDFKDKNSIPIPIDVPKIKPAHSKNTSTPNLPKKTTQPPTNDINENHNTDDNAVLLFKSGFENGVYIDDKLIEDAQDYRIIRGSDVSPFSWPINILGAKESGLHYVFDDNQKAVSSIIETTTGHDGSPTKALYQQENYQLDDSDDTQCPYEILDITDGAKDLYIRYWVKLDSESITKHQNDLWRTFFEYKTKDYDEGTGFRLISFIDTDEDGIPYWHWQGDETSEKSIWEIKNKKIPVPLDEWFLTEFYWHWSENEDGQALWKVNNQIVGNHFGPTTRNSKPIDFIMLFQIYGTSNPKHQWIDDIEIWDTIPKKYQTTNN